MSFPFTLYHHRRNVTGIKEVLHCLNRQAELKRLINWAAQKSLDGPYRLYKSRLAEEENRLIKYQWRTPQLLGWARLLHTISCLVSPPPRYLPRGSAARYRYSDPRKHSSTNLA